MPSEQRNSVSSAAFLKFSRTHGRLSRTLIIALITLVLVFDLLCVYAKQFMGAPLVAYSVFSNGMAAALLITLVILAAALHYVRRINSAYLEMRKSLGDD